MAIPSAKAYAHACYAHFATAEGNQYIASVYAIERILEIVKNNRPARILEIGLGIGSVSYSVLGFAKSAGIEVAYYGTESNPFCLSQLPLNLGDRFANLHLYPDLAQIDPSISFDFIIIDGSDASLDKVKNIISPNGIIFIEGDRRVQVHTVRHLFPLHRYTEIISNFKNPAVGPFSSSIWSGGGQLIYINPTPAQKASWLADKVRTSFNYRVYRRLVG